MIFERDYRIQVRDIRTNNKVTNKGILSLMEDIGGAHSDKVGFGIYDIPKTHVTWILLDWKLEVKSRPQYGDVVHVKTWSRYIYKCYAYRDFEIYDKDGNLLVIATSKWVLVDTEKNKIKRIEDYIEKRYESEPEHSVFDIQELDKIKEPENVDSIIEYTVLRRDIDIYRHMHNLYYLDLAYEALPEENYFGEELNNVRITYKKEIKLGSSLKCMYTKKDNKHIVVIKTENIINSIIEIW